MVVGSPISDNRQNQRPNSSYVNKNNNPIPGTREYVERYGNGKGYTVGGVQYDSNGNPIRTTQAPNTQANRTALDKAGLKYTEGGSSLFTNSVALEEAIRGGNTSLEGAASTVSPQEPSPKLSIENGKIQQDNPENFNPVIVFGEPPNPKKTVDVSFGVSDKGSKVTESIFNSQSNKSKTPKAEGVFIDYVAGSGKSGVFVPGLRLQGGSAQENAELIFEANRASQNVENNETPDYSKGGTIDRSPFGTTEGPSTPQSKALAGTNFGQSGKGQLIRNTVFENNAKQNEAEKAFQNNFKILNNDNPEYNLWTNQKTPTPRGSGGIETPQSKFIQSQTSYGQNGSQNVRDSPAEKALMVSEADRALAKEKTENVSFTTFTTPKPKTGPKNVDAFNNQQLGVALSDLSVKQQQSNALDQGLTNLSNNQKYFQQEKEFNDYLTTNANKGATIDIIMGDKTVGSFQGPKAISGVQAYEKAHPDETFSISAYFPEREKALTEAVQSNTSPFLSQPQSYWNLLGKQGYLSKNNAQQIQNTLYLESAIENRESLANGLLGPGSVYLYKTTENGGAASFARIPFSGGKTYNDILGSVGIPNRAGTKASTNEVPSTSLANLLIFAPTFGNSGIKLANEILEDLAGQGAKVISKAPKFKLTDLGESANSVKNQNIRKVLTPFLATPKVEEISPQNQKPIPKPTLDITPAGSKRATFRNTNPTRTRLPSDILSKDTTVGETTFSNTPKLPPTKQTQNSFEDVTKETQNKLSNIQNDLLNTTPKVNNPPASTNIPFFAGRINAQGKQLTGNKAPINLINPSSNEAINISGKTSSIAPIVTSTVEDTGLSPISRENFAPQFIGVYPESYLPSSPIFQPKEMPDIYSNAGEGVFDASTFRNNAPTNYKEFEIKQKATKIAKADKNFGFLIKQKPLIPIRVKNAIGQYYKETSPFDFVQQPRAERVENRIFYEYPFSSSGKRLSVSEAAQEGPLLGALRPITPKTVIENEVQGPKALTRPSDIIGKYALTGKSPIDKFSVKFTQPINAKEFFGLAGEKVEKGSGKGKYSGLLPLENYGFSAQKGEREGDISDISKESGLPIRKYSSKEILTFGPKVGLSAKDIWSDLGITGKSEFPNVAGGKYYTSSPIYEYGNTFPRGSLQNKDVGLIKFEKFQENKPTDESKMGDKRFNQDVLKFKQFFNKTGIFSPANPKEVKGLKFKSTSSKVLDFEKPKETKNNNDASFKSNIGSSKSETILINKKPIKKEVLTSTTLATDYEYDFLKTPPTRESGIISTTQKDSILSGLKFSPILSPKQGSKSSLDIFSKNGLGFKNFSVLSPKLGQNLIPRQNTRQTPKQIPGILQTHKQSPQSKQTPKQKMSPPQIPRNRQTQSPNFKIRFPEIPTFEPPIPPKVPIIKPNFSNWNVKNGGKGKNGPTGLENLSVNNVFASSFDIKVPKGKRFEF